MNGSSYIIHWQKNKNFYFVLGWIIYGAIGLPWDQNVVLKRITS